MSRLRAQKRAKQAVEIVTDGESEKRYLERFKQIYRCSAVKIKKINPCGGNIIYQAVRHFKEDSSKHVVVFDKDALTEGDFENIKYQAARKNIMLVFSNICFEVWLLAHFERVNPSYISTSNLNSRLSNYLHLEYRKGDISQINSILRHYDDAIANSQHIEMLNFNHQCTNVGVLCEMLKNE